MTDYTKQTYRDIEVPEDQFHDIANLAPYKFDILQLKYDGHWCRLEFDSDGLGSGYTTSNRQETNVESGVFSNSIVLGEHLYGTNWAKQGNREGRLVLFDIVSLDGRDLSPLPYARRWDLLNARVISAKHPRLFIAMTKPIDQLPFVWRQFVLGPASFEGVVFRRWDQTFSQDLHRAKKDVETTYYCVGFEPGKGKHEGRLGSLLASTTPDGEVVCRVGGGLSDSDREYIWTNQHEFLNRQFDATGKQLFDTGALRHPNFLRWK